MASRYPEGGELHEKSLRELRSEGERLGLPPLRKDVLIQRILAERERVGERTRWWNALRRMRNQGGLRRFLGDDAIVVDYGREFGSPTAMELEDVAREEGLPEGGSVQRGPGGGESSSSESDEEDGWSFKHCSNTSKFPTIPGELTRSEVLTELGRHERYSGMTHKEISGEWDRTPSTGELASHLGSLGGPASSSPERVLYSISSGLERLRSTGVFGDLNNDTLYTRVMGQYPYSTRAVDDSARCADVMREGPRNPREELEASMREVRKLHSGLDDQKIIEVLEGDSGPLSPEDLERAAGRGGSEPDPEPPKDSRWWDAMRKLRTIRKYGRLRDEDLVPLAEDRYPGVEPGRVTPTNLFRLYDLNRSSGIGKWAMVPRRLSRRELLAELAKFPEYEGVESIEEAVPREGKTATTRELRRHLRLLGGPSSSSPKPS